MAYENAKESTDMYGRLSVYDGKHEVPRTDVDLRIWADGHVQVGSIQFGNYISAEKLEVGEIYRFRVDNFAIAVKRVADTPYKAPIIRLPERPKSKNKQSGGENGVIVKLRK